MKFICFKKGLLFFIYMSLIFSQNFGKSETKVEYYIDGKMVTENDFVKGGRTGEKIEFHENGKQKAKGKVKMEKNMDYGTDGTKAASSIMKENTGKIRKTEGGCFFTRAVRR